MWTALGAIATSWKWWPWVASPPAVNFSNPSLWSLQGSGYTPTFTGATLEMTLGGE